MGADGSRATRAVTLLDARSYSTLVTGESSIRTPAASVARMVAVGRKKRYM
jgi:hypothetical protein